MSILSLHNASLQLANNVILDKTDFQIQPAERIALVGRNGAGKSTFLRLLMEEIVLDDGRIQKQSNLRLAALTQDVPPPIDTTVHAFLAACQTDTDESWNFLPQLQTCIEHFALPSEAPIHQLSGGMQRKVLLAAALLQKPDLLLLDEPTNHLDLPTIEWLESYLNTYTGSVLFVTHDREFLQHVATRILEIDRGHLHSYTCDYETYLDRREARLLVEEKNNALFDKRLSQEESWIRQGIEARRTRNEGRVRRLQAMRETYKARRNQISTVRHVTLDVGYAGKIVLEATNINYRLNSQQLITDFSLLLTRGDKVGIIGPNGCGKTTLLRILLGDIKPDTGKILRGTSLKIAYFDQLRRELDEKQTVMANVGEGSDHVTINDQKRHVASYLQDFLFTPDRFNQPVFSLSGGERNRLLLAKLFAKPVNLLVMDEPTNDLDLETLELLESMLVNYTGTLLVISHDRAFINHVVSSVLVYEENGHIAEFVGGYDDYLAHRKLHAKAIVSSPSPTPIVKKESPLTFTDQKELKQLPSKIETAEKKLHHLQAQMAEPGFYQQAQEKIDAIMKEYNTQEALLETLYDRWASLESTSRN